MAMTPCWLLVLLCSSPLWQAEGVEGWGISTVPSESECRPYIEKALKEHQPETPQEAVDATGSEHETLPAPPSDKEGSIEETEEATTKESTEHETGDEAQTKSEGESAEATGESTEEVKTTETEEASEEGAGSAEDTAASTEATDSQEGAHGESLEEGAKTEESTENEDTIADQHSVEGGEESAEATENVETSAIGGGEGQSSESPDEGTTEDKTEEEEAQSIEETQESTEQGEPSIEATEQEGKEEVSAEQTQEETQETTESAESLQDTATSAEEPASEEEAENIGGEVADSSEPIETQEPETAESAEAGAGEVLTESTEETAETAEASTEDVAPVSAEETTEDAVASGEETTEETTPASSEETSEAKTGESPVEETQESVEAEAIDSSTEAPAEKQTEASGEAETSAAEEQPVEETPVEAEVTTDTIEATPAGEGTAESEQEPSGETAEQEQPAEEVAVSKEEAPTIEDQLSLEFEVPKVRRQREHIAEILKLTPDSAEVEMLLAKTIESTLKELKKLYDSAIKPLEILYKYRDLSNRHFGDPEIFSKPLILFMGPWSGGKSSIINYLLNNEFQTSSLRTGAEPSPAYFNILMWGEREEVLDGTQLAADWTFSGLQKFGQGLLDRLRGLKLNNPLLEKVNIVEIPGILEIRKQVERLFPFNDACQWFIDRADIIFLVYDPSKLDVGPETEAILDQLKGREYQTRILLNKADQVKPEELMRVQGTLIWNISPLMSSQEPPILYSTSLWSVPYEQGAPTRLLHAQERAFLRDLRSAVDKRVENKIASARRFAVRVRNHAKMVDCYLTTYYNHKTFFGNRKKVADDIIEHPQNYHIYEGLSTLTNISRYDLPDPEVYRDFFRLNPVYDFQRLSDTCTYFRGCPINRLDVAIAYDLPELVGKYKKQAERVLEAAAAAKS